MKRSNRYRESCGPGPASGWYWTVAPWHVEEPTLNRAVVEVDVGQLGLSEISLPADRLVALNRPRAAWPEHREAVVLAGDLSAAGREVLDRVVGAVMSERQLVGLKTNGAAEQLVPEADPVDGPFSDQLTDGRDDVPERGRVAGPVGEEEARPRPMRAALPSCRCTDRARPRAAARRWSTIERLTPVSIIAISLRCGPRLSGPASRRETSAPGRPRGRGPARTSAARPRSVPRPSH